MFSNLSLESAPWISDEVLVADGFWDKSNYCT